MFSFKPGKRSFHWTRKIHRWLAVTVGVQLSAWVAGGMYFTLADLDWIHGDHLLQRPQPVQKREIDPQAVTRAIDAICHRHSTCRLKRLDFTRVEKEALIRVHFETANGRDVRLFSATTGAPAPPLGQGQAVALARHAFTAEAPIARIEYLSRIPPGHEYRNHPLPVWAVHFDYPGRPVVYVAQRLAAVTAIRHDGWRAFDFLWMLHTLDFTSRDDINNPVLRIMAPAAMVTITSGYVLYFVSRRRRNRRPASRGS